MTMYVNLIDYPVLQESPFPQAKSAKVGEVGWGVVKLMDTGPLKSGHQIMVHHVLILDDLSLIALALSPSLVIIISLQFPCIYWTAIYVYTMCVYSLRVPGD